LKSRLPVLVVNVDSLELARAPSLTQVDLPSLRKVSVQTGEVQLTCQLDQEFQIILRQRAEPFISIDNLEFADGQWVGSDLAVKDLCDGVIRHVGGQLDMALALKICAISAMLDFGIDEKTWESCVENFDLDAIRSLPIPFQRKIVQNVVSGAKPSRGFVALANLGALVFLLPELAHGENLSQNRFHKHDIFYHSIYACDAVEDQNLPLRLAALLHDVGKSATRRVKENGEATFHNHEVVGARQADRMLKRLGFAPELISKVRFLVRNHMFHYTPDWTDQAVRRFIRRVSPDQMRDLIALRIADRKGSGKRASIPAPVYDFLAHMERIRVEEKELKIRDLAIGGHDLMQMGMAPGPVMGDILKLLLERVKNGELANDESSLKEVVMSMLSAVGARA